MNSVPSGERIHIGIFGRRNAGKSSMINAITGQELAVVSDFPGTTTDPVKKAMEILPLGPVVLIDTPGIDDEGTLGEKRVEKAMGVIDQCDMALIIMDITGIISSYEIELIKAFDKKNIPYILVLSKKDLLVANESMSLLSEGICKSLEDLSIKLNPNHIEEVSMYDKDDIHRLKEAIARFLPDKKEKYIVRDLVQKGDTVILVIPIDEAAPKGRIILPQQMVLRELLDNECIAICVQPETLRSSLDGLKNEPSLVITDSQAFKEVASILPESIRLTSFSVLMAKYKGDFESLLDGASAIDKLQDGDKVLIAEACTHHRQCNDIGTVKIPALLTKYTGKELQFSFTSGGEFPGNLDEYKMVVHCGGCMIGEAEMKSRMALAKQNGVAIVNYGMLFAKINGILERISNIL